MKYAKNNSTTLLVHQNDFESRIYNDYWEWSGKKFKKIKLPLLPLVGDFQYNHASAALMALEILEPSIFIEKDIFKDKKIEMIETSHINYGGGNVHWVTMNVPKNVN